MQSRQVSFEKENVVSRTFVCYKKQPHATSCLYKQFHSTQKYLRRVSFDVFLPAVHSIINPWFVSIFFFKFDIENVQIFKELITKDQ